MNTQRSFHAQKLIVPVIALAVICALLSLFFSDIFGEKGSGLSEEFTYDLTEFQKTDPALILYEETGSRIKAGFERARAIAVNSKDQIYVAGGKAVHAFTSSGKPLPLEIECEQEITAITVADDDSIYIGAGDHIEIFDPSGALKKRWEPIDPKALLTSIAIYKEDVFIADAGNRVVHHFNISGGKKESFGDFVIPSAYFDLAISADGLIHLTHTGEHRIETYGFDGNLISWWGGFSNDDYKDFCGCCNPVNFAILPDGGGYVTCEKGLTRIKLYDNKGVFKGFVAGPEQFEQHDALCVTPAYCYDRVGLDTAVDSKGRVLALDPILAEIRIFELKK